MMNETDRVIDLKVVQDQMFDRINNGWGRAELCEKYNDNKKKKAVSVPFHINTIPKPQHVYGITVNNFLPFEHVLLRRSGDGSRYIHPLVSFLRPLRRS